MTESRALKQQILTLTPSSWSRKKAAEFFDTSEQSIRNARDVAASSGVLSTSDRKPRTGLPTETIEAVLQFFNDDETSRILPGKKDTVSVRKNVYEQKRLLLGNGWDLYNIFRAKEGAPKIGYSKFWSLKPKWCVSPGSSGTLNVCVCAIHQNAELLAKACGESYKDMMEVLVCDTKNRYCMVHRCSSCPGMEVLREHLYITLENYDDSDSILVEQWISTDHTDLKTMSFTKIQLIDKTLNTINKLTGYSFIA